MAISVNSSAGRPAPIPSPTSEVGTRRFWLIWTLLTAEAIAFAILRIPGALQFKWFAFFDNGIEMTFGPFIDRGYRPAIDFGFIYGLLSQLITRAWFGIFARSPVSLVAAEFVCGLLLIWALARFAAAVRAGWTGVVLLVVSMPSILVIGTPSFVQSIEPVFLANALAEHARGNRARALALVTASVFIKPSMAFVYGFLLLCLTVVEVWPGGWRALAKAAWPALATALALAAVLAAVYGLIPLVLTVFPIAGSELYKLNHFGFFHGLGRDFWHPAGARIGYYLGTVVGFWLASTIVLAGGGLAAAWHWQRSKRGDSLRPVDEVTACCALMHLCFVTLFFGNAVSWFYYFYVLLMGLVAVSTRGRLASIVTLGLTAIALLGNWTPLSTIARDWRETAPRAEMAGLWASAEERAEWSKVVALTEGERPVLLAHSDGAAVLFPQFARPEIGFLTRGFHRPVEIDRKLDQIRKASMIVVVHLPPADPALERWPEFAAGFRGTELVWEGKGYRVYRRTESINTGSSHDAQ